MTSRLGVTRADTLRGESLAVRTETEPRRVPVAHHGRVDAILGNHLLVLELPERGLENESSQVATGEVLGCAHRRAEDPLRSATGQLAFSYPGDGVHWVVSIVFNQCVLWVHASDDSTAQENLRIIWQLPNRVDVGWAEDVLDAA